MADKVRAGWRKGTSTGNAAHNLTRNSQVSRIQIGIEDAGIRSLLMLAASFLRNFEKLYMSPSKLCIPRTGGSLNCLASLGQVRDKQKNNATSERQNLVIETEIHIQ